MQEQPVEALGNRVGSGRSFVGHLVGQAAGDAEAAAGTEHGERSAAGPLDARLPAAGKFHQRRVGGRGGLFGRFEQPLGDEVGIEPAALLVAFQFPRQCLYRLLTGGGQEMRGGRTGRGDLMAS